MAPQKPSLPQPRRRPGRLLRLRPLVQGAFLLVWTAPVAALRGIPGCTFHCYGCPLASFACPVGLAANGAAMLTVPLMVIGVVALAGALVGSMVCGWACPFGLVQDLLARIPAPKFRLPRWAGYGRYVVLAVFVIGLPMYFGSQGMSYVEQSARRLNICGICPAGALEAGVPSTLKALAAGNYNALMSPFKAALLGVFLATAVLTFRPWCRLLCPLGGVLSLFNRVSVFHVAFRRDRCVECNLCRSRCSMNVQVEKRVNQGQCIRCLECTTCGAITPAVGRGAPEAPPPPPAPALTPAATLPPDR